MELDEDARRSIVAHFAHLRAAYGEVLGEPDLVEPNGDYFPDDFELTPEGIDRLMRRMLSYVPLSEDLDISLGFIEPEDAGGGGGCGSGACGTEGTKEIARGNAVETGNGYGIIVNVKDVGDSTILTTVLARAAGRLVLFEADEEVDERDEGAVSELTAIACGLGVLMLNGGCVYKKGCGGMRRHQATFLGLEEIALGLALFVRTADKKPGTVRRHLEVTQRESFDAALAWVDSQPKLLRTLKTAPETLADGVFELETGKGFFARLFAKKEDDGPTERISAPPRVRSADELRRIAEAKALVEDALGDT